MKVIVKLGAPLAHLVGESKVRVEVPTGATVADLFDELQARYPDFEAGLKGKGLPRPLDQIPYTLMVNGRPLPLEDAQGLLLHDGDQVTLFLPVAGG